MLLFDLDGTLLDSNGIWVQVDLEFLARRGHVPTREYTDFVSHAIFPTAAAFTREYYGLADSEEAIMAEWMDLAREAYAHRAPLKEGVLPYLQRQAAAGEEMALFTASVPQFCRLALERHGIAGYFSHLLFAQEMGVEKRSPEAFRLALTALGREAAECTFFDDAPRNCAAARQAGLTVVGVYDPFYDHAQEEVCAASHRYIRSFAQLAEAAPH